LVLLLFLSLFLVSPSLSSFCYINYLNFNSTDFIKTSFTRLIILLKRIFARLLTQKLLYNYIKTVIQKKKDLDKLSPFWYLFL
ncbi:hypothetical protein ART24_06050, partial [Listeria monocytogenes]|nr:hypothetical protein [Listeria monocytogenes]